MAEFDLKGHLDLDWGGRVEDLLEPLLVSPVREFMGRPGKKFRGQLVSLGWRLIRPELSEADAKLVGQAAELLERVHAGSLVVDDIQDDSEFRRGKPTMHRQHGMPLALNAGNWLYFQPLEGVREWGLPAEKEVQVYRLAHQALFRAHLGQALDLGVPIDDLAQSRIPEVCWASLELKTGALMGLGISLGALLAGAPEEEVARLLHFGKAFGVSLQMFDDLGNLGTSPRPNDPKQLEDLRLRRPSAVWAIAAETQDAEKFAGWVSAVRALPATQSLWEWLEGTRFALVAKGWAHESLSESMELLKCYEGRPAWDELRQAARRLTESYG